jgi:hypothetical protein
MKKYLFKILSVSLAVWMVAITGGLHLYAHECGCCDVKEVSMINIEQCCGNDALVDVCCNGETERLASCCEEPHMFDLVDSNTCSTDGCCTISHSYLKFNETFTTAEKILLKSYPVLLKVVQVLNTDVLPENDFQKALFTCDSSPPGFTGKAFLIFTHTLKIPLSLQSPQI